MRGSRRTVRFTIRAALPWLTACLLAGCAESGELTQTDQTSQSEPQSRSRVKTGLTGNEPVVFGSSGRRPPPDPAPARAPSASRPPPVDERFLRERGLPTTPQKPFSFFDPSTWQEDPNDPAVQTRKAYEESWRRRQEWLNQQSQSPTWVSNPAAGNRPRTRTSVKTGLR